MQPRATLQSQDCSETLPPSGEMRYDSYAARTTGLGLRKLKGEGGKKSGTKTVAGLEKAKQCRRQEKGAAGGGELEREERNYK